MANLTITKANIKPQTGATLDSTKNAGETITAGASVRLDGTTDKWMLANNGEIEIATETIGIAVCDALLDQRLTVQTAGDLAFGAILTVGDFYYVSSTDGLIADSHADLSSADYPVQLGYAGTTSLMTVNIVQPGVVIA
jgi:hypothetical protein